MRPINVEMLMGDSYYRPPEKDLLEDYLKAVPSLTINEDITTVWEEMVRRQQELAAEIKAKDQEMQALRNDILETKAVQQKKEDAMQEQIEEIRDLYMSLINTLNEAVDLRRKIPANPQDFLQIRSFCKSRTASYAT